MPKNLPSPTSTPVQAAAVEVQAVAATDTPVPTVPAPTDTPSAPTNTPEPLPPLLLESSPAQGSNWDGGPVRFTFDQPLAPDSALAVTVKPDLGGSAVVEGDALVFTPAQAAQEGVSYTFRLGEAIASAQGIPMPGEEEVSVSLRTPLMVTSITPGDGNRDVATDSQITLVFNRPVVELVGVADQANLVQPLSLSPDVAGSGRWVSTSVYVFSPEIGLAGSTEYAGVIADLTAVDGGQMAGPVNFSFLTAAPVVAGIDVSGNMVRPDTAITVQFSQPMDRASTEAAFSLTWTGESTLSAYPEAGDSACGQSAGDGGGWQICLEFDRYGLCLYAGHLAGFWRQLSVDRDCGCPTGQPSRHSAQSLPQPVPGCLPAVRDPHGPVRPQNQRGHGRRGDGLLQRPPQPNFGHGEHPDPPGGDQHPGL